MRLPVLETRNLLTNTLFVGGFAAAALVAAACSSGPDPNDPSQMQPSGGYGYNNNDLFRDGFRWNQFCNGFGSGDR